MTGVQTCALPIFIALPWRIYKDDPNWVTEPISEIKAKFNPEKNPYYDHSEVQLFIAERNGIVEGRIVAHIDHIFLDFWNEKVGFFGFFECTRDYEVAKALYDRAGAWLSRRGMERIRGPFSFSTNDVVAFLLEGFSSPPVIMMPYNPEYYIEFAERYGFVKAKDLVAYFLTTENLNWRIIEIAERLKRRSHFTVRSLNFRKIKEEIALVRQVYNKAWERNWGFVPMTEREFEHIALRLKQIADKELVFIAEADNKPIGFFMALPDINLALAHLRSGRLFPFGFLKLLWWARRIKSLRVLTLGVIPGYRKRGVEVAFYREICKRALKKGYTGAEMSWILEDNFLMRKGIEDLGGKLYKKYRLYEKKL